ncbi:hypothetical protein RO3G_08449 [Rhizopus delemar RA 99-880]|uniref:Uncharacterized protein n=1 Tax=Rhizopus delemar (strain RA 99-880 / ATCC MYA-4621 / FGSC 9543 / NRRL 43880) TaxID=246409 RepID=I1C5L4_RHIO9|nr:hypothetical protein RO3G_08449 [Rhizopus delemar RA 99-880]|eukprot:EIE83744.1 hypothetical protein RO3G_08449 [Rhizopus delemar RA 99-880]
MKQNALPIFGNPLDFETDTKLANHKYNVHTDSMTVTPGDELMEGLLARNAPLKSLAPLHLTATLAKCTMDAARRLLE